MELLTTYNMTTLIGTAKTATYAAFNAWYQAICTKYSITPEADPTDYFDGTLSATALDTFISVNRISHTPMISELVKTYNDTKSAYDLGAFIALAPTNTQTSFKTWKEIVRLSAVTVPSTTWLNEV